MSALLGGSPDVAIALAQTAARLGDTTEVLAQLRRVAAMGAISSGSSDSAFDSYRALPAFRSAWHRIEGNARRVGRASVVATLPDSDAILEDLGWDGARHRFIISDVRHHLLRTVDRRGRWSTLGSALSPGWAPLGLAVDSARGVLWVGTATLPQAEGYVPGDSSRAAILRLDLSSGRVLQRYPVPGRTRAAPGDLALALNHDLYSGDGMTGAVYLIRQSSDTLETLVASGVLHGTQQPVILPDQAHLLIPDYTRGLAKVDLRSRTITWLSYPNDVTVTGIDGMTLDGRALLAVQNGVAPARVVRLALDSNVTEVAAATIVLRDTSAANEPTHLIAVGDAVFLIGNAGWSKFDDAGQPERGRRRAFPQVLELKPRDRLGSPSASMRRVADRVLRDGH